MFVFDSYSEGTAIETVTLMWLRFQETLEDKMSLGDRRFLVWLYILLLKDSSLFFLKINLPSMSRPQNEEFKMYN